MEVAAMLRSPLPQALWLWLAAAAALPLPAQDPAPPKGPDKEVAEKLDVLKDCVLDKKLARDADGVAAIDVLLQKLQAGVDPKDHQAIVKGFDFALTQGKLRPPETVQLYIAAAAALGQCGVEGAKVLKSAYLNKRFPERREWVPLREVFLRHLGKTKDEAQVKFLCVEARTNHEAALQAAAGEALGNYEDSKDTVRKEIVGVLIAKWGEIEEIASQVGTGNMEAQNAQDRRATISDKWSSTLEKLTRQTLRKFTEWQTWFNKNKGQPWP
jgi:hypothetical protein